MPGERFSGLYLQPGDPTQDSGRARHRVGALFRETVFNNHTGPLAVFVGRELGVAVTGDGRYSSHWHQFIRECSSRDFFDAVTLVYRYLFWHVSDGTANWWRDTVQYSSEIFPVCQETHARGVRWTIEGRKAVPKWCSRGSIRPSRTFQTVTRSCKRRSRSRPTSLIPISMIL